jgi:general secretion pathway protein D
VRGLGDIPVIGNLFKYRSRTRAKRNLMVFLRPVVVRSKEQNNSISMDRYDYMRAPASPASRRRQYPAAQPRRAGAAALDQRPAAGRRRDGHDAAAGAGRRRVRASHRPGHGHEPQSNGGQPAQPGVGVGRVPSGPAAAGTHTERLIERS